MAKNNNKKTMGRTLENVLADINSNIEKYNESTDPVKRNELGADCKKLVDEYNQLSLFTQYATFKAAPAPLVALASAYTYPIVATKDTEHDEVIGGVKTTTWMRSLDTKRTRMLNVTKFIEWMAERNVNVAHKPEWRTAVNDARAELVSQWKNFIEDGTDFTVSDLKKSLQEMVDALIFHEGAKGNNAYVVTSKMTRSIIAFCNSRKDGLKGNVVAKSIWEKLQMDILHGVVEGKEFTIVYGDPEAEEIAAETEEETDEATSETETEAK